MRPFGKLAAANIFLIFLRLGLTSFGGPIAHLAYFEREFVGRRRWLSDQSYAEIVALCQFLPGPASSQTGMALGLLRAGWLGALAAWLGFTLPSAVLMTAVALYRAALPQSMLQGLLLAAVAVVAQAVWNMARRLSRGLVRGLLTIAAACATMAVTVPWSQLVVLAVSGLVGAVLLTRRQPDADDAKRTRIPAHSITLLVVFALLLIGLPLIPSHTASLLAGFYRSGALVFGGGHVVLPLLQAAVVEPGWVDSTTFLSGYAAAQAMPGPLFTFAAFLGASMHQSPTGWLGAVVCTVAIFAPSLLLVPALLPLWTALRGEARLQSVLAGINAGVVGLLLGALYRPVSTSAIRSPVDGALAAVYLVALTLLRLPPWLLVITAAVVGYLRGT